jgi:hypothetical protein
MPPLGVPMMERRHFLKTHLWAIGDIPRRITQVGTLIFYHRCVRCGRDFMQTLDEPRWRAANVGFHRIDPLPDKVTERWKTEECPGRLLLEDRVLVSTRLTRSQSK